MKKDLLALRAVIREELNETRLRRTREGNKVEFASEEYISEVEQDLEQLIDIRARRGIRERERYVLSQAVRHLRNSLERARKTRERLAKIKSNSAKKEKLLVSEDS